MPTGAQEIACAFKHGMWIDHVLEDMVHRNDVIFSDMIGQVGGLQRTFEDVVSPVPALGRDLRLDLDARALQVEESAELVEVPTVTGPDVKDACRADSGSTGRRIVPAIEP